MTTFIMIPVAAGAILAFSVPILALKEILEKRSKQNFKKHLARNGPPCRVHFGEMDETSVEQSGKIKRLRTQSKTESVQSPPPSYKELYASPPAYTSMKN